MQWKQPKNTSKYHWTLHVTEKMHYYGLSEQKVLGVIRNPKRTETGIVDDTVAVMAPVGNVSKNSKPSKWKRSYLNEENQDDKWNQEIWVMYQLNSKDQKTNIKREESSSSKIQELQQKINSVTQIIIISAWRYPGVSPQNNPIPEEILREIEENVQL